MKYNSFIICSMKTSEYNYKLWMQICASYQMIVEIAVEGLLSGSMTAETEYANSSSTVAVMEMETASVQDKSVKSDVEMFKVSYKQ